MDHECEDGAHPSLEAALLARSDLPMPQKVPRANAISFSPQSQTLSACNENYSK
jgi:hypothetical protein